MSEEQYQELLKTAPEDHFSPEFKVFLVNNNKVRFLSNDWLIIENKKYWTPENDWLTASCISQDRDNVQQALTKFFYLKDFKDSLDREWLIKSPNKRTVKLFHIHMYKK